MISVSASSVANTMSGSHSTSNAKGDTLRGGKMSQRLGRPAHDTGCIQVFYASSIGALQPCEAQELAHNTAHAFGFPCAEQLASSVVGDLSRPAWTTAAGVPSSWAALAVNRRWTSTASTRRRKPVFTDTTSGCTSLGACSTVSAVCLSPAQSARLALKAGVMAPNGASCRPCKL